MPHDRERRPTEFGARGLAAWFHLIVWAFVVVPWWVLVVFHPVQDARLLWKVVTRPASSPAAITAWLAQSYSHVLPIWFRARPHQDPANPHLPGGRLVRHASGVLWRGVRQVNHMATRREDDDRIFAP
jgi:hypothetical protein